MGGGRTDCHWRNRSAAAAGPDGASWGWRTLLDLTLLQAPFSAFEKTHRRRTASDRRATRPSLDSDSLRLEHSRSICGLSTWLRGSPCRVADGHWLLCHLILACAARTHRLICVQQQSKLTEAQARAINVVLRRSHYLVGLMTARQSVTKLKQHLMSPRVADAGENPGFLLELMPSQVFCRLAGKRARGSPRHRGPCRWRVEGWSCAPKTRPVSCPQWPR